MGKNSLLFKFNLIAFIELRDRIALYIQGPVRMPLFRKNLFSAGTAGDCRCGSKKIKVTQVDRVSGLITEFGKIEIRILDSEVTLEIELFAEPVLHFY